MQLLAPVAAFGWAKQPCVAGFDPKVWGACIRRVYNARIAGKVEAAAAQVAVGVTMAERDGGGNSLFPTTLGQCCVLMQHLH